MRRLEFRFAGYANFNVTANSFDFGLIARFSYVLARIIPIVELEQLSRLSGSKSATNIQTNACSRHHVSWWGRRNRRAGG